MLAAVIGAAAVLASLAGVALWRKKRATTTTRSASVSNIAMQDIYPESAHRAAEDTSKNITEEQLDTL